MVASFAIVAYVQRTPFTASDVVIAAGARDEAATWQVPDGLVNAASWLSVVALLLTIATGFVGSANPLANFNMTFFWIVFTLGLTYLTAIVGDVYAWANPWRTMSRLAERIRPDLFRGAVALSGESGLLPGPRAVHGTHLDRALRLDSTGDVVFDPDRLHGDERRNGVAVRKGGVVPIR